MGLDIELFDDFRNPLFYANTTHNHVEMARWAGVYDCLWRPETLGWTLAEHVIPALERGVTKLALDADGAKKHNPPNGWGAWEYFLPFCCEVLAACKRHPKAKIEVCLRFA
jgi:hypothetical protein